LGAWERAPTKGQGVSIQKLSTSNYNKEEPENKAREKEIFSN
jgi:hypothetical protein